MAFSAFLDRLDLLICGDHDLVQVDVIVQIIVELKPFERLEHLVDLVLELLDELFVLNPELALAQQQILLCDPLTLLVQNPLERLVLVLLHLHNLRLHIADLTQNIQLIGTREDFFENLAGVGHYKFFEFVQGHVCCFLVRRCQFVDAQVSRLRHVLALLP